MQARAPIHFVNRRKLRGGEDIGISRLASEVRRGGPTTADQRARKLSDYVNMVLARQGFCDVVAAVNAVDYAKTQRSQRAQDPEGHSHKTSCG
jgi:hypothetical protein